MLLFVPLLFVYLFSFVVVSILIGVIGLPYLGVSNSISPGTHIIDLLNQYIPTNLVFTVIPIALGVIAGIFLGISSVKVRFKLAKVLIQIFVILGLAMPVFFLGMIFQYTFAFQLDLLPAIGEPILPGSIMFLSTMFLTTRQVRSNYLKSSGKKNIIDYNLQITMNLWILITNALILETIFNLQGFFYLFRWAILINFDYPVVQACIFIIIVFTIVILFISNVIYIIFNYF